MAIHAKKYAPSAASRWMSCTASPLLISELMEKEQIVERPAGLAAQVGTAIHSASESLLRGDIEKSSDVVGFVCDETGIELDDDHAKIAEEYVDLVRKKRDRHSAILHVEQRVHLTEECFGTGDALLISPNRLAVWDLKTGSGHRVSAKDNWQLAIYGAAALKEYEAFYDFETVELGICQPPLDNVSRVVYTPDELRTLGNAVVQTIEMIEDGNVRYEPSEENCRWCAAASLCPAMSRGKIAKAVNDFENTIAEDFDPMIDDIVDDIETLDWGQRLELVPMVRLWCDSVEADAKHMLLENKLPAGNDSLGDRFKVVQGRSGNRFFADPDTAVEKITGVFDVEIDELYSPAKLYGPAKIEKLLAKTDHGKTMKKQAIKDMVDVYCDRAPGAPTVAPIDDPREPFDRTAAALQDFADE